jgi:hypothetical protein
LATYCDISPNDGPSGFVITRGEIRGIASVDSGYFVKEIEGLEINKTFLDCVVSIFFVINQ